MRVSEETEQDSRLVRLENVSERGCRLEGYPRISLLDSQGALLSFSYRDRGDQMFTGARPARVLLAPHSSAYFAINKSPCAARPLRLATRIRIRLPGDSRPIAAQTGLYPLLEYCQRRDAGLLVDVTPVEPTASAVFAQG
jgi:hypothetical protein